MKLTSAMVARLADVPEDEMKPLPCLEGKRHEWATGQVWDDGRELVEGDRPDFCGRYWKTWKQVRTPGTVFAYDYKLPQRGGQTFICIHCRKAVNVTPQRYNPTDSFGTLARTTKEEREVLAARPIVLNMTNGVIEEEGLFTAGANRHGKGTYTKRVALETLQGVSIVPVRFRQESVA